MFQPLMRLNRVARPRMRPPLRSLPTIAFDQRAPELFAPRSRTPLGAENAQAAALRPA